MPVWLRRFWRNDGGAVAPTVALSLVGLIAAGGIAFDYARLASMDTELQSAADQAALAAAGQLDGASGSCTRAAAAASSLLTNNTLFANDGGDLAVTVANEGACDATGDVRFYQSYEDVTDTFGDAATSDSNARVVAVTVGGRTANFALTPIVGALSSGNISAQAVASLSSAICNVPPLMVCVPGAGAFPAAGDIGKGVRLQPGPQVGAWAPGDYGYLDFANGASGLATNLGSNNEALGCVDNSNGIPTEPGNKASVTDALNSRLDLYPASATACDNNTGNFCPAQNTRKDLLINEEVEIKQAKTLPAPSNPGCGAAGSKVVGQSNATDRNGFVQTSAAKGFTRDRCHTGEAGVTACTSNFGDGDWDRAAYFAAVHAGQLAAAAIWAGKTSTTISRHDVYRWELDDKAGRLAKIDNDVTDYTNYIKITGPNATYTFKNQCTYPEPKNAPPGVASGADQKDRRILTVAAVDCTGLNGKGNVVVKGWIDMFLVEPSLPRSSPYATSKEQIYTEIIGVAEKPNGQAAYQFYLKQRPRLIR